MSRSRSRTWMRRSAPACGKCAEVCQYHAIVVLGKRTLVFSQLCHGCGSCTLVCPEGAISEEPHVNRHARSGARLPAAFRSLAGCWMSASRWPTPAIRQLKRWATPGRAVLDDCVVILDVPPGTSCPVVEAVRGADYLLLVTEPTPFGLHDLRLAAEVAAELGIPAGVIINRDGIGDAGRGQLLHDRGATDPAAHPVRACDRRGDCARADAGGNPPGIHARFPRCLSADCRARAKT